MLGLGLASQSVGVRKGAVSEAPLEYSLTHSRGGKFLHAWLGKIVASFTFYFLVDSCWLVGGWFVARGSKQSTIQTIAHAVAMYFMICTHPRSRDLVRLPIIYSKKKKKTDL